ncbi:MAG: ATP-dependent DNA helicase RecG [Gammaproteobacteria bacterium]|nr:ATP-dependent DNA helicase RecG [Gammaproteobacteria bacterium]
MEITRLKGVGAAVADKLQRIGIEQIEDLLFHLPLRYQDRTRLTPIVTLQAGSEALVEGEIISNRLIAGRRRTLQIEIAEGNGQLRLRFFHFNAAQQQNLAVGKRLRCFGLVKWVMQALEIVHPDYQLIATEQLTPVESSLTPIYPTTEGLAQKRLRTLIAQAFLVVEELALLPDLLPQALLEQHHFPPLLEALTLLHNPPFNISLQQLQNADHPAQQRLIFEELLAHHLSLRQLRRSRQQHQAPPLPAAAAATLRQQLLRSLPFQLTGAQQRVSAEIQHDLELGQPMQRLVQGDVGCGKTVVAALAALQAISHGWQVALMAPTELLAEQHYRTLYHWLAPLGIDLLLLAGQQPKSERLQRLQALAAGTAQLAVGTHALFQQQVDFARLGLIIIDEQHRFGVHQRLLLQQKGDVCHLPHQLTMTATPIPRTLAMTAYADLDLSTIDELPAGRQPIKTVVMSNQRRDEVLARVRLACREGHQAYWVCPLISESEKLQCQAAEATWQRFVEELPELGIGLIHGRLATALKESTMQRFQQGEIQLLVATTVIEVGVDVANASLMIIENAERLGLSQLHQLRGRVGRGHKQSSCILLYEPPLGNTSRERLAVMRESNDGFYIAQRDLEIRGPGELLGTRQTGIVNLRIADLNRDAATLAAIPHAAATLLTNDSEALVTALTTRWLKAGARYAQV